MNRLFHTVLFRPVAIGLAVAGMMMGAHAQTNSFETLLKPCPTNSYWTAISIDPGGYDTPYRVTLFKPQYGEDSARVWSQTKSLFVYGGGVALFLAALPESMTGWDTEDDIFSKWVENVKAGPVWDHDNWAYNYIGHAYVGGVYYQVARKSGYRQWDAFTYTALMSTFYWEYGVEAFAEIPSIQDLVYTPLIGWVYGEWAFQTEMGIRDRGNKVAGSKILGETSLFFLDPIDTLGRGVNRLVGRNWVKSGYGYFSYTAVPDGTDTDHTVYLNMRVPIGGKPKLKPEHKIRFTEYRNDPVDTGIVGLSAGAGYTLLDDKWEVEDDFYSKISLGLYFTPRFSARVGYAWADLKRENGEAVVYENYSLDAQYYLNTRQKFRPYITAGFGEQLWEEDNDLNTFQLNAGLGLHWQFHRKWALQADWVNYFSSAEDSHDQNLNAGIIYRFGFGEHDDW